jgi:Domain of unknown function (DUF4357)
MVCRIVTVTGRVVSAWRLLVSVGKQIRIYLVDGTPGGLLTAEIMNWTGHVVAAPRSDLRTLLRRQEASRTGIYILLGDDPETLGGIMAYVGEGDDVSERLAQHARPAEQGGKDFWDRAVVLSNKDANLTKAHARYLESRFIALARQAARSRITNGTSPLPLPLPEADVSDMEYFITQAKIILPVLGVNIFRSASTPVSAPAGEAGVLSGMSSPTFTLCLRKDGITATAREIDGEFTVLQGSQARPAWTGASHSYKALYEKLVGEKVLIPEPDSRSMRFARDQVFASPSAAAAVVTGRQANGRVEWKVDGSAITFGDWQTQGIEQLVE